MTDGVERRDEVAVPGTDSRALERISDADRDRATEFVQKAVSEGRLGLDEIDERLGAVVQARTRGDLEAALVHLPGADRVLTTTSPAGSVAHRDEPTVIRASHTTIQRTGRWEVPPRIAVKAKHSVVLLDLMEAVLPGPEVHIDLDVAHGGFQLVVPDDIRVETDDVEQRGANMQVASPSGDSPPARAVIRISGRLHWSNATVGGPGWRRRRALRKAGRTQP